MDKGFIQISHIKDFISLLEGSIQKIEKYAKHAYADYDNKDMLIHDQIAEEFKDCMK